MRMSKDKAKNEGRKAVNLSLTPEATAMLEQLKIALRRPSKSNVVESLAFDKAKQLKLVPA